MVEESGYGAPDKLPEPHECAVATLGEATIASPLRGDDTFIDERARIYVASATDETSATGEAPSFEAAGPRERLFFDPATTSVGIVTCGGLCPGVNDVIRSVVLTAHHRYGVRRVVGFRYGYAGLAADKLAEPVTLELDDVTYAHRHGGTMLGSSRGPQDLGEMVDTLQQWEIDILVCVGGDGTLRGAAALTAEITRRGLPISVIGIPKTIDNDLLWSQRSFGFMTAVEAARTVVEAAHTEAEGAYNGVGLVKLMGRYSGSIAAQATLANGDVNFCLVPEVPFTLHGEGGLLDLLLQRLEARHHALIVVAEGAGQDLFDGDEDPGVDASGNPKLHDVGALLINAIKRHCRQRGMRVDVKYIDPSYTIRGLAANSMDSAFCLVLGQHAVHAGMAGRTEMMVGFWNHAFTHVPLSLVTRGRRQLDAREEVFQRVLDATGQPAEMVGRE
jgi:6-phosphofructokinase 1